MRTGAKWRLSAAAGVISSVLLGVGALAPAHAADPKPHGAAPNPADGPVFMKLPPIVLPVFEGRAVTRQASLVLSLELAKGKAEEEVAPQQRRLVDAFIADLYQVYDERSGTERVIDSQTVKSRLQASADRVLGAGVVREVLIQQAFERPRRAN